ncbi:MAG: VOC family protein [Pseudomonadota bacterium]
MRVLPHLMFQGTLSPALEVWCRAFPDMSIRRLDDGDGPITRAEVTLCGQTVSVFDSPQVHDFDFTPAFSFMVQCSTTREVDRLAAILGEDGRVMMPMDAYPFSPRFTWITDPFGVNWQIMMVPDD